MNMHKFIINHIQASLRKIKFAEDEFYIINQICEHLDVDHIIHDKASGMKYNGCDFNTGHDNTASCRPDRCPLKDFKS